MLVTGIDPGPVESAWVCWDGETIRYHGSMENRLLLLYLADHVSDIIAIEQIRGFGVPAGNETFDTCMWTGRFFQAWGEDFCRWVPRKQVVAHLCGTGARGGDKFVREALIARIGPQGTKKAPGATYGMASHLWSALAVAVTWLDLHQASKEQT